MTYKLYDRTDFSSNYEESKIDVTKSSATSYSIQLIGGGGNGVKAYESYHECAAVNNNGNCTQWNAWGDTFPGGGGSGAYVTIEAPTTSKTGVKLVEISIRLYTDFTVARLTYKNNFVIVIYADKGGNAKELLPEYALLENSNNDENVKDVYATNQDVGQGGTARISFENLMSNYLISDYIYTYFINGANGGLPDNIGVSNGYTSSGSGQKSSKSKPYGTPALGTIPADEENYTIQGAGEKNAPSRFSGGGTSTIDGYTVNGVDVTQLYRTGSPGFALVRENF